MAERDIRREARQRTEQLENRLGTGSWWRSCLLAALIAAAGFTATSAALEPAPKSQAPAADGPAAAASSEQTRSLLTLLDVSTTTAEMGPLIAEQFALTLISENPDVADSVSESFREALIDVLGSDLADQESRLWQSYVDLYQRNFDAAEMDDLIQFYGSATGRKYLRAQQALFEESGLVLQAWVYGAKERVILRFEELMAQRSVLPEQTAAD